jgi:hypothetical protein
MPMRLVLSVGNKVMGFAPLDAKRINDRNYLEAKIRLLKSVYFINVEPRRGEPVFYIQAPSKMNKPKR